MKEVEAVHLLGMFRDECERQHMESEAAALQMAIEALMPVKITTTEIEQDGDVFATILGGNENGSDDK